MRLARQISIISLILLLGFLPHTSASQESEPGEIDVMNLMSLQRHADQMTGSFVQAKFLSVFPRPIVSRGMFTFIQNEKLVWTINSPIENEIEVYKSKIKQTDAYGNVQVMDSSHQPFVKLLGELFFAILSGDSASLGEHFEIAPVQQKTGWKLILTPKSAVFLTAISSLELLGDQTLDQMIMFETGGDRTEIEFTNVTVIGQEQPCKPE